jgi:alkanesulfonate monooxygenase SsuD/methylene tetrahydromethanopterin reductase-like flavin-dependent oxidoreductase (luciferase family)
MTDYGLPLQFGLSISPDSNQIDQILPLADVADKANLDFIAIQDHPYNRQFLDTWTLITFLAARTQKVRFFPDVVALPMRPPAILAKAVASLDRLTGGRIELGLGAGAFWDAIAAMGGTRRAPPEAVEALEEAIQVIRLAWSGERSISFAGQHYHLRGYQPGPTPAHTPGIWLGAVKPRMLRLTGRLADGWVSPLNVYVPPQQALGLQGIIDEAAREAGRAPSEIRRIYNVIGSIGDSANGGNGLNGSVDEWVTTLTRWVLEVGFDTFIFWPEQAIRQQVELFAHEVAPAVRAAVEQSRVSKV